MRHLANPQACWVGVESQQGETSLNPVMTLGKTQIQTSLQGIKLVAKRRENQFTKELRL